MEACSNSLAGQDGTLFKGLGGWSKIGALAFMVTVGASGMAAAQSITFSGSLASSNLAASVTFSSLNSTDLVVTLTDTYMGDTVDQSHVLTGVYFSGATGLTPLSASAGSGSVEWAGKTSSSAPGSSVLGTEWAYLTSAGNPGGAASGILSSGYGSSGRGNFASPGDMLDGTSYGLLSVGYAGSDLDGLKNNPYISDSMVFILSGFTGSITGISDVSFQYGSTLAEPNLIPTTIVITPVPEPTVSADAAVVALALLSWAGWRKGSTALKNMALKWRTDKNHPGQDSNVVK